MQDRGDEPAAAPPPPAATRPALHSLDTQETSVKSLTESFMNSEPDEKILAESTPPPANSLNKCVIIYMMRRRWDAAMPRRCLQTRHSAMAVGNPSAAAFAVPFSALARLRLALSIR